MLKLDLYCCHECLNTTYASGLTKVCCKALPLIDSLAFQSLIPEALDSLLKFRKNIGKKHYARDMDLNIHCVFSN